MNSSILVAFVCLFNTYSVPGYAVMRIGWLAGIIGLNLNLGPTPRVGRMSKSIDSYLFVEFVEFMGRIPFE